MLNKKGYVFLKNVIKKDNINHLNLGINNFIKEEHIFTKINSKQDFKEKKYYVNNKFNMLNTFQKIQYYRSPVINVGGNKDTVTDKGLITFYNINNLLPFIKDYINIKLLQTLLFKLTNVEWNLNRVSLKLSNNVTNPSKIHIDNYETCIKCTIYLNDIPTIDSGSNIYIEKSHINNRIVHNRKTIKYFTGEKGDMLISFDNGFHGRNPNFDSIKGYLTFYFVPVKNSLKNFNNFIKYFRL